MKHSIAVLALIACVAADVSHLNRQYLPPVQYDSGASASSNAGARLSASYTSHHRSIEYGQQSQEVPVLGGKLITYGNEQPQAPVAATLQYNQLAEQEPQQLDVPAANEVAGIDVEAGGAEGSNSGSYVLSRQDLAAQVLEDKNLLIDSNGKGVADNEVDVDVAAEQGPAVRTPQPVAHNAVTQYVNGGASASSGIDTQYGANGGYIY